MDSLIEAAQAQHWKQVILVRRDLNMSPGKLAAQVAHGSMAFLSWMIRDNAVERDDTKVRVYAKYMGEPQDENGILMYRRGDLYELAKAAAARGEQYFHRKSSDPDDKYGPQVECDPEPYFDIHFSLDADMMWGWFQGTFTKVVLGVKDKQELDKILTRAWKEYGMEEGRDWFAIRDNCLTELEPEEIDENGIGRTLTVVGFKPMPKETIDKVTGRLRLL